MMRTSLRMFLPAGLAASIALAGCQGGGGTDKVSRKDAEHLASILADTAGKGAAARRPPIQLSPGVVFTRDDIPNEGGYLQISFGDITDAQANKLIRRLKTEYCTCGCPHTIDQCLIDDPQCDVAQKLAHQILKEVTGGS